MEDRRILSGRRAGASLGIPDLRGWQGYGLAAVLAAASILLKGVLAQVLATDSGHIIFVPAIALSAWLGGFRAGLLATTVAALLNIWFFVLPTQTLIVERIPDQLHLVVFLAAGAMIGGLSGRLRGALRQSEELEADVARSRDQLQAVLDSVADGITVQSVDGSLVYANEQAAHLLGFSTAEEVLAAPMAELLTRFKILDERGEPLPLDELPSRHALRGERGEETLIRFRVVTSGEERRSLVQAAPILDGTGRVRFAVNIFRDVTERHRREEADRFLADATTILAETLDETATIERLAALAIERLADWCVIDVVERHGAGVRTAIAHQDPARRELARRWRDAVPFEAAGETGPARVIRTGKPELVAEIGPEMLEAAVRIHPLGRELMTLGLRSMICVPLMSRGRAIGAVTLVAAESGRRFDEHDLSVAEALGERAGVALENSRLYQTADERRAELSATLAALGEAVLVFDAAGRLMLHNPAASELLIEEPPGTLAELGATLDLDAIADGPWPETGVGRPLEARGPDGRWLEVSAYRVQPGATEADTAADRSPAGSTIVVIRDITGPRAARTAREAFMGVLSHELRTPITTIYGGTRLLDRELSEEHRMEVVRDVRDEAERLYRLVEDLLVMTRVERGGVEIGDEPILLQRILDSVVRTEQSRWPGLEVRTSIADVLPAVRGDLTYVEQVVRNLLGNAAKYGGVNQPVDMVVEPMGSQIAVRVLDRGPGIGAEEAEDLFELFYRGATTSAMASGAGIGLFVCRALVTAMGGRMWATPREGGGSEFGFSLPVLEIDEIP